MSSLTINYEVTNGLSPLFLHKEIVTLTICGSLPDLLLGLYFTESKLYPILVHLPGIFLLIVTKAYLILLFLKIGLRNGHT